MRGNGPSSYFLSRCAALSAELTFSDDSAFRKNCALMYSSGAGSSRRRTRELQFLPPFCAAHSVASSSKLMSFAHHIRVEVNGRTLKFARAVIATGARAGEGARCGVAQTLAQLLFCSAAPAIPGLKDAGYLTNQTVFNLTQQPRRLAVIGTGAIGLGKDHLPGRMWFVTTALLQSWASVLPGLARRCTSSPAQTALWCAKSQR